MVCDLLCVDSQFIRQLIGLVGARKHRLLELKKGWIECAAVIGCIFR